MSATGRGGKRRDDDAYFTPEPLAERLVATLELPTGSRVLEPHGGGGAFVRGLVGHGAQVDTIARRPEESAALLEAGARTAPLGDFLQVSGQRWDWVVGNPPYHDAEQHVRKALEVADNVAFLLRLGFLESRTRSALFAEHMPASVFAVVPRPSFSSGGTDKTPYGWFVWRRGHRGSATLSWATWEDGRRRRRHPPASATGHGWQLQADHASQIVDALDVAGSDRVAVVGGSRDTLYRALADVEPATFSLDRREALPLGRWDWVVGAPPIASFHEVVAAARPTLRPGGRLVLLLPILAVESRSRLSFWREHPPECIEVLTTRPRLATGQSGALAMALFSWSAEPTPHTCLDTIDVIGMGRAAPLLERLRSDPAVRRIHRDDPQFAEVVRPIMRRATRLGTRLDELAASQVLANKTIQRLEHLEAALAQLERPALAR